MTNQNSQKTRTAMPGMIPKGKRSNAVMMPTNKRSNAVMMPTNKRSNAVMMLMGKRSNAVMMSIGELRWHSCRDRSYGREAAR